MRMNSGRRDESACGETLSKNRWLSFPMKWGRVNKGLSTGATHPFRETLKARLSYPCVLYWQWRRWNENQCSMINILGKETPWGWILLSLFFKICFFERVLLDLQENWERGTEVFYILAAPHMHNSHIINTPHQSGAFVTTLTGWNHPRSIVYLKVHS